MTFPPTQVQQLPQGSSFGLEFNYAVWTPGTTISLSNVPWNSDYRDIVHFPTQADLNDYLLAQENPTFSFPNMTYAKPGNPVRVNLPFNTCYKFNYLRATNAAQPVPGTDEARTFYYFITDVKYIAPNTTELQVQLDVWQTFGRDVNMGNCFVERGHIGIANIDSFDDHGRTYLTVPEGLDVGNEYVIAGMYEHTIASSFPGVADASDVYGILVTSTVSLKPPYGTVDAPVLRSADGSNFEFLPNGCETYFFKTPAAFYNFITFMADKPWVTQGIISITAVPQFTTAEMLNDPFDFDPASGEISGRAYVLNGWKIPEEIITLKSNFRNDVALGRYTALKKFLVYPYTVVEMTTFSGNPIILKPECVPNENLTAIKMMHLAPPNPRIVIAPMGYNMPKGYDATNSYAGEFLDMATGIFDLPTFSIVNNGYISYMASNRNGIAYQHSSADWSQQRALQGAQAAFDNANTGMENANTMAGLDQRQTRDSAQLLNKVQMHQAMLGNINGGVDALGALATTNPVGGAIDGIQRSANAVANYAIQGEQNVGQYNIATGQTRDRNIANQGAMGNVRDTNNAYARSAAKGDYQNAIAAINAKVQDAKMTQPTTSGQIGGDAFNLAAYKWGVFARLKTLQPAAMALIGEFWLRYGYSINRFSTMPSNYQVMDTFTYWKLRETYITSSTCPETFRQTIRGIFEKGVTVWSDPDNIGNVDMADNAPLTGVTL